MKVEVRLKSLTINIQYTDIAFLNGPEHATPMVMITGPQDTLYVPQADVRTILVSK